mmetsp:Transcript_68174/g.154237  ORF Transcript_68174/g.154237 Transcript_68174/m.154237 type:complete len:273 (+) Transcript_68174:29-847(+)
MLFQVLSTALAVQSSGELRKQWNYARPTLHAYDCCHFTTRTRLVLGTLDIPFDLKFYPYGEGADPEKCGGTGYKPEAGPVYLTGKKSLPALEGVGVPCPDGFPALGESSEIMKFALSVGGLSGSINEASQREDVASWINRVNPVRKSLERPRILRVPLTDWATQADIDYMRWMHVAKQGFDYEAAEADTSKLTEELAPLLEELESMLHGTRVEDGSPTLQADGVLTMDDILIVPILRNLSCVKAINWPPKVRDYLEGVCSRANVPTFFEFAN